MELFGYQITKKAQPISPTPVTPLVDGSSVINSGRMSGCYGYGFNLDIDGTIRNEVQMINRYREIATYPDCDAAIEQIVNEAVIVDQSNAPVSLNLDRLPEQYNDAIKDSIRAHFDKILAILDFNDNCHDIFKRWYVDGKLYYYVMVDAKNPHKGIVDIKYVDPRKIRHVTEYIREDQKGVSVIKDVKQYYVFNDNGLENAQQGIRVSTDSIIHVKSGLVDAASGEVISHLFKAIKPVNQLKMMEDALVIYRISRAPERRVFYVDVGNLPAQKAEQYVQNIMSKFRNKVVYDAETGEVKNNRNYMSCMEDFWLPRREGGKATEIQTLPGGNNLSEISDIQYFQNKLYQALNVPRQRLMPDNMFNLGTTAEITREEVLFAKFIQRLRNNFNVLFKEALRLQLICTRTLKASDWDKIANLIHIEYQHDNYFEELKRIEVWNERMTQLQTADSFKGTYFSREWIVKNVLQLGDEEWTSMKEQIANEVAEEAGEIISTDSDIDDVGPDPEPNRVEQSDDPDELNNTVSDMEPNVGEDDFEREGEPGLVVTK